MHNVQNAMFAAGLAYCMDVSLENIRHGLRTFGTSFFQAPGRMNIYDEHPFKVILDYAHNPAAVKAMCALVDRFEPDGRRIVVLAAPGDRRDEDIRDIAAHAAGHFDHYICREDDGRRGRDAGEVPRLLKQSLLANGVDESQVEIVESETAAVDRGLRLAQQGDLLLVLGDRIKRCWKQIIYFGSGKETPSEARKATKSVTAPEIDEVELDESIQIIRDQRGVRIAREPEDAD